MFDAEFTYVCRVLRRLGVRDADLEDVSQEVFMAVHKRYAEYDPGHPRRPWLFSFALRVAANYRRRAHHARERICDELDAPDGAPTPEEQTGDAEQRQLLLRALDSLDFDRRTVFVMHDIEQFSANEIAQELSIPVNTVYSRLRNARLEVNAAVKRRAAREAVHG